MSIIGRFRLIVPGATAKAAPKLGQALGPLGINMVTFCKDFNARTTKVRPEVPIQATLVPRTDRTYKFFIRSPMAPWFLLRVARLPKGSDWGNGAPPVGNITLKELYHVAKAKSMDPQFIGIPTRTICLSLMRTAKQMGIKITKDLQPEFAKRNDEPVEGLEERRKQLRLLNKASKKGKKKWGRSEVVEMWPRCIHSLIHWCEFNFQSAPLVKSCYFNEHRQSLAPWWISPGIVTWCENLRCICQQKKEWAFFMAPKNKCDPRCRMLQSCKSLCFLLWKPVSWIRLESEWKIESPFKASSPSLSQYIRWCWLIRTGGTWCQEEENHKLCSYKNIKKHITVHPYLQKDFFILPGVIWFFGPLFPMIRSCFSGEAIGCAVSHQKALSKASLTKKLDKNPNGFDCRGVLWSGSL